MLMAALSPVPHDIRAARHLRLLASTASDPVSDALVLTCSDTRGSNTHRTRAAGLVERRVTHRGVLDEPCPSNQVMAAVTDLR